MHGKLVIVICLLKYFTELICFIYKWCIIICLQSTSEISSKPHTHPAVNFHTEAVKVRAEIKKSVEAYRGQPGQIVADKLVKCPVEVRAAMGNRENLKKMVQRQKRGNAPNRCWLWDWHTQRGAISAETGHPYPRVLLPPDTEYLAKTASWRPPGCLQGRWWDPYVCWDARWSSIPSCRQGDWRDDCPARRSTGRTDHFDHTYVSGSFRCVATDGVIRFRRTPPRFPPHVWNVHEVTLSGNHRTNNICESWNSGFKHLVGSANPSLWTVITSLKKDVAHTETENLQHQHGIQPRKRRRMKNTNHQNRLKTLCDQLVGGEKTVKEFLVAIGQCIRLK